jgi:predicted ATP-grasp superfamily ATP-dependent carboligase
MTAGQFSKFTTDHFVHADPEIDEAQYFQDLLAAIETYRPDDDRPYMLIPGFRDAALLSKQADRFDGKIILAAPPHAAISQVTPKQKLADTLDALDIPHPGTWQPQTADDIDALSDEITMPALIKAVDEVGGRGIEFFEDKDAFLSRAKTRIEKEDPKPLIQEMVDGHDYCFCGIYQNGELKGHMVYHNLQTKGGAGSAGAMRETVDSAPFLDHANRLMKHIGWNGIAEIDFMWTGNTQDIPQLIEVNPRFWAGLFQSVESGVDFPWMLYQLFADGDISHTPDVKVGTKTRIPGLWATGALSEALNENIDFEGIKSAWQAGLSDLSQGNLDTA